LRFILQSTGMEIGSGSADEQSSPELVTQQWHTRTGDFRFYEDLQSQFLGPKRNVLVYLPPGYDADPSRRYPTLYLQDGQNLFDSATAYGGVEWGVDETAQALIETGEIEPLIIVGVYNTGEHRIDEYTPTLDPKVKKGGQGDRYGRFLIEELKPFIDSQYRTRTDPGSTGLGGSSLGGLLTLYLGLRIPQRFGRLMVMSPSVWWDGAMILRYVESLSAKSPTRIWLDIGTREGRVTPGKVRQLNELLIKKGWRPDVDLSFLEVQGGQHSERDWAARVGPALKFLYPLND
jgi:predicted alpha/beta superfamily hydrolase